MLLEAGDRQPRSLAEAFSNPCKPHLPAAAAALSDQLARFDAAYATGEDRRVLTLVNSPVPGAVAGSLSDLALWAQALPGQMA
jgi:CRISPR system Cascade subunit CasC